MLSLDDFRRWLICHVTKYNYHVVKRNDSVTGETDYFVYSLGQILEYIDKNFDSDDIFYVDWIGSLDMFSAWHEDIDHEGVHELLFCLCANYF